MKDIKQDLQRKISSYQTLLKKTYGDRNKQSKGFNDNFVKQSTQNKNDGGCRPL
jgi:hypothetical protein